MRSIASILQSKVSRALPGALLLLFVPAALFASISIQVAPPVIERVVKAGTDVNDTISFTNAGTTPLLVTLEISDFDVNSIGSISDHAPGTTSISLAPFLKLSPLNARVRPGQKIYFRYSLKLPQEFSHLRTKIYFVCTPDIPKPVNGVVFAPRIGVPLYMENIDSKPAELSVNQARLTRSLTKPDHISLKLSLENMGQRNIRPKGYLQVVSKTADFRQVFPFNEGKEPVLPGRKREWELSFGPVPDGDLSLKLQFDTSFRTRFEKEFTIPSLQANAAAKEKQIATAEK